MGNSSSQVAPTQATQAVKTPKAESISPTGPPYTGATATSQLKDDMRRATKRQKVGDGSEPRKKPRSRPQHRRGIAIQPKLDAEPFQPANEAIAQAEADLQLNGGNVADTVAGAEIATEDSPNGTDIVVNTAHKKQWQKVKEHEHVEIEQEVVPETHPEQQNSPNDAPDTAKVQIALASPKKEKKRKKKKAKRIMELAMEIEQTGQSQDAQDEEPQAKPAKIIRRMHATAHTPTANTSLRPLQAVVVEQEPAPQADPMPTPPDSPPEEVHDSVEPSTEAEVGELNKSIHKQIDRDAGAYQTQTTLKKRINGWLDNGEFTRPPMQPTISPTPRRKSRKTYSGKRASARREQEPVLEDPEEVESPTHATGSARKEERNSRMEERNSRKEESKSRKRKRSNQYQADDSESYADVDAAAEIDADAEADYKELASRPTTPSLQYESGERGSKTGPWRAEEKAYATQVWNDYLRLNNLEDFNMRAHTVDWKNIGDIKTAMYEAFPNRTIDAIRKFCQRYFTPYKVGAWTSDEDTQLREAYTRYPMHWTNIGDSLGRPPGASRDRWRLIVRDSDTREVGPWSTEEEARLKVVVEECVRLVLESEGMKDKSRQVIEEAINWKTVNEKMGRTRSEKRCLEKWRELRKRQNVTLSNPEDSRSAAAPPATPGPGQPLTATSLAALTAPPPNTQTPPSRPNRRKRIAELAYQRLLPGDIVDALRDIAEAFAGDLDKIYPLESTFWAVVAEARREKSVFTKHSALRRRCYEGALERWGGKKNVRKAKTIQMKALKLMERLERLEGKGRLVLARAWEEKQVGGGEGEGEKKSAKKSAKESVRPRRSEAVVVDDGDEAVEMPMPAPKTKRPVEAQSAADGNSAVLPPPSRQVPAAPADDTPIHPTKPENRKRPSTTNNKQAPTLVIGPSGSPELIKQKKRKRMSTCEPLTNEAKKRKRCSTNDGEPSAQRSKKQRQSGQTSASKFRSEECVVESD